MEFLYPFQTPSWGILIATSLAYFAVTRFSVPPRMLTKKPQATGALAPELLDYTIDFLHSDKATLSACSLVCKRWLPSARYHLFSHIILRRENLAAFYQLSKSRSFDHTIIRRLEIWSPASSTSSFAQSLVPSLNQLHLMPNISTLRLRGLLLTAPIPISFATIPSTLCPLKALEFLRVDARWHEPWVVPTSLPVVPSFPRLSSLEVDGNVNIFLQWILAIPDIPKVSRLVLFVWNVEFNKLSTVSRYLSALGPTLRSLKLIFPRKWNIGEVAMDLDLSHNVEIRSLVLMTHVDLLAPVADALLHRIRVGNLETLSFAFIGSHGPNIDLYQPLDVELSSSRFQRLQSLSLSAWSKPAEGHAITSEEHALRMLACFPLACKRGIVSVTQSSGL
ncbi:hypothetical protein B0H16DRAFT_1712822 [Mycena metata]|uniref:F-box domain-containing protein n=1 Tax=Mycena metata TaxID=1033252 RepID=A0AAD7NV53_9AGAR|nr:hypothetical protein B0H16DRAFT_1712822 [Mycena metata]